MVKLAGILSLGCLLVAAVASAPTASPVLKDIHDTKLNLYQSKDGHGSDYGHFAVRVERVDEVLDVTDHTASAVAARISDILVTFDVNAKGEVAVNGHPVKVGMSNVKVAAKMIMGVKTHTATNYTKEEIASAFDQGIVNLAVHVTGATIKSPTAEYTRVIIAEQITEVNGKKVSQKALMQQVFEIHPGGQVLRGAPCSANGESAEALKFETAQQSRCRVARFFRRLPVLARLGFSLVFGAIFGLVAVGFVRLVRKMAGHRCQRKRQSSFTEENSPMIEKAAIARTHAEDEKLPVYHDNGYTPVALDEKKTPQ